MLGVALVQDVLDLLPDVVHISSSIESGQDVLLAVVRHEGRGVLSVRVESLAQCRFVVVAALHEGLASLIVLAGHARGLEVDVVRATRGHVDQATSDALHQQLFVDLELQHAIELGVLALQHHVELEVLLLDRPIFDCNSLSAYFFSLFDGTRETIQNKSSAALSGVNIVLNQIDHNLVRHEFT